MVGGRTPPLLMIAAFVAVALAGCSASGFTGEVQAPEWKAGYTWSVDRTTNGTAEWYDGEDQEDEMDHIDEHSRRVIKVLNTTLDIGTEPIYLTGYNYIREDGRLWSWIAAVSQRDLGGVPLDFSYTKQCVNQVCAASMDDISAGGGENYSRPDHIQFPLTSGKSWTGLYNEEFDDDAPPIRVTSKVAGRATIETALGLVDVIRIDVVERPEGVAAWKAKIQEEYSEPDEGFVIKDLDFHYASQGTMFYSPEYMNVVLAEFAMDYRLGAVIEEDGEEYEFREVYKVKQTHEVVGARLTEEPEQDLDAIAEFIVDDEVIEDPSGTALSVGNVQWDVEVVDDHINAAADETGLYRATLEDPEGNHTIKWTTMTLWGEVVDTGSGLEYAPTVDHVGTYYVMPRLVGPDGNELSRKILYLKADAVYEDAFDCFAVTTFGFPGCSDLDIPVRAGIGSLEIRVTPSNAIPLEDGFLRLYDQYNQLTATGSWEGDDVVIRLQRDDLAFAWDDDWRLDWSATVGVLEEVDVTIGLFADDDGSLDSAAVAEVFQVRPLPWQEARDHPLFVENLL